MSYLFDKRVGHLQLAVSPDGDDPTTQCVMLVRHDSLGGHGQPMRLTVDDLRDLQYLVNRALDHER